jgi:D-tyrosyl-tRNA(Tyr) deacylase
VKVVLQRVSRAQVSKGDTPLGEIGRGYALLVGFRAGDGDAQVAWMAGKVLGLRVFPDAEGKMNLSLADVAGDLLVVSQFTLYGDVGKGRRPSFVEAAVPELASALYERFVASLRERAPGRVATGEFGAAMHVELVNDGPVTLILEKE